VIIVRINTTASSCTANKLQTINNQRQIIVIGYLQHFLPTKTPHLVAIMPENQGGRSWRCVYCGCQNAAHINTCPRCGNPRMEYGTPY
jgi:rubrerythrin